jgi:hypothetical protein
MIRDMAEVAVESLRDPSRHSVWHADRRKYVCPKDPEYQEAIGQQSPEVDAVHPPINPAFKLVFLTAAIGTLLFTVICVGTHVYMGDQMSGPLEKTITGMFDMAKIGFGAIAGMLGARTLTADT